MQGNGGLMTMTEASTQSVMLSLPQEVYATAQEQIRNLRL